MTNGRRPPDNDLVLRALRGERTERTPVWLMRQAGRFDPAYRQLRAARGLELEELFAHPEYAAEITTLPLRFGVDAAILFQDILTLLGPMGAPFIFRPGPLLDHPIRSAADANRLAVYEPSNRLGFVFESIHRALDRIEEGVPLLGFAGAPFTLLAFLTCGKSPSVDASPLAAFLSDHPGAAAALLGRIAEVTAAYLRCQIDAGVHAVQLFESCADLVDASTYQDWALPYQRRVFAALRGAEAPTILFAKGIAPEMMASSGASAISVGSGVSLGSARRAMSGGGVQGNLDNGLLLHGTPEEVRKASEQCIKEGRHVGHVLNLGHGVLKDTPVANVEAMITAAHSCICAADPMSTCGEAG